MKTKPPDKGRRRNPSGEYDDRPAFAEMLELIKTGQLDAIVCWRDDRLVRHPRVAVALEDALDEGDKKRKGQSQIEILEATGAVIDRFTLRIKAAVWKEENIRRAERSKMGKIGILKAGRWPGTYQRYGYKAIREEGKRGRLIQLADENEVNTIKWMFRMADAELSLRDIRRALIAERIPQRGLQKRKDEWSPSLILKMLKSEEYTGTSVAFR